MVLFFLANGPTIGPNRNWQSTTEHEMWALDIADCILYYCRWPIVRPTELLAQLVGCRWATYTTSIVLGSMIGAIIGVLDHLCPADLR